MGKRAWQGFSPKRVRYGLVIKQKQPVEAILTLNIVDI